MRPSFQHKLRNVIQSALMIGGMALIAWTCVAVTLGPGAAVWALAGLALALLILPQAPKTFILSLYRAVPLRERTFPEGVQMLRALAAEAALPKAPTLYYLPSTVPNAFAVGSPDDSAIAVSDGLLRILNAREFYGVLAHEVSHIANRDLWIMALADMMARITSIASFIGLFFLALNLPLALMGRAQFSWILILFLIFSPTLISLLQLSLSRSREYDADLRAVELTGDPDGLASALRKLDRVAGRFWEEIFMPGRRSPDPSLLRTHPPTEERLKRLAELAGAHRPRHRHGDGHATRPTGIPVAVRAPRWHRTGAWF